MEFEYIEVVIKYQNEIKGQVRFELGPGNKEYYIHRADILSSFYLFQHEKKYCS